ncbi:chromosome segregation protein SMC [archaeon]|nr:chromosome segregation protein SMC [archaeon]
MSGRILSVRVRNFKVFGPRTTCFQPASGLTLLIGPNGQGKSSLLQATILPLGINIRRVLRLLGVGSVIDLFHRKEDRVARKISVEIAFDNADRFFPIDSDQVVIRRVLTRSEGGVEASKFYLNGRRVQAYVVQNLLHRAGIDPTGFNIVPQGAIVEIANKDSEELAAYIRSLAGIEEFEERRRRAEKRLAEAEQHLRELRGRRAGEERFVLTLSRDLVVAQRRQLTERLLSMIETALLLHERNALSAQIEDRERHARELEENLKVLREQIQAIRQEINGLQRQLQQTLPSIETDLAQIDLDLQRLRGERSNLEDQIRSVNADLEHLNQRIDAVRREKQQVNNEREARLQEINQLLEKQDQLVKQVECLEKSIAQLRDRENSLINLLSSGTGERTQLEQQLQDVEKQLREARNRLSRLQTRLEAREAVVRDLESRISDIDLELSTLREQLQDLRDAISHQQRALNLSEKRLTQLRERYARAHTLLNDAREALSTARILVMSIDAQRSIVENLATAQQARQRLLELARAGIIPGVLGVLRDLIKVLPRHKPLIEAVLRDWLDAYVVEDLNAASQLLAYAKRMQAGRIIAIPVSLTKRLRPPPPPKHPAIIATADKLVRASAQIQPVVRFLLGGVVFVSSPKAAAELAQKGYTAITRDGVVYTASAVATGSPSKLQSLPKLPILTLKRVKKLVKRLERLTVDRKRLIADLKRAIEEEEKSIETQRQSLAKLQADFDRLQTTLQRSEARRDRLAKKLASERAVLVKLRRECNQTAARVAALESRYAQLSQRLANLNPERIEREIRGVRARIEQLKGQLRSTRLQIEDIRKKIEDLRRIDLRLRTCAESLFATEQQLGQRRNELQNKRRRLLRSLQVLVDQEKRLEERRTALLKLREDAISGRWQLIELLNKRQEEFQTLDSKYRSLLAEQTRLLTQVNYDRDQLHRLDQKLHESAFLESATELLATHDPDFLKKLKALLHRELREIGPVNERAFEEYNRNLPGFKKLSERLRELEEECNAIRQLIERIEQEKHQTVRSIVDRISHHFARYLREFFPNSSARLFFEDPQHPADSPISIRVRIGDKPEMSLMACSGGEKVITAICLILAFQELFPAPFYIFDEIDAGLDARNAEILARLIRQLADRSQVIIVSHRGRELARLADKIVGVFTADGRAHLVSVRPEQLVQQAVSPVTSP